MTKKIDTLKEVYGNRPFTAQIVIWGDEMFILSSSTVTEEDFNNIRGKTE